MRLAGQLTIVIAVLAAGGLLSAQTGKVSAPATGSAPAAGSATTKKDGKARPAILVTPEREAAVTTFVQRNHAELAELLGVLKASQPDEYERAVKEIFRATERMEQIRERDPLQYELEVVAWTAQSRVQLLAARLKMGSSDELVKQLREALKTQNEAKLTLLKHERQKAADRVSKLESDIARFESDREEVIDKQLKLLTRAAAEGRPAKLTPKNTGKQARKNVAPPEKKPANQQ
ncbi:MAG TPA: hypothetical protein VKH44_10550 [Pirellulaceae bacterium]|nr:hypothetical protein [Pirellulaceae bacterium]